MAYKHIEFPKYKYHKTHEPKIVLTKEQDVELGHEWHDSPAHVEKHAETHAEKPEIKLNKKGKFE